MLRPRRAPDRGYQLKQDLIRELVGVGHIRDDEYLLSMRRAIREGLALIALVLVLSGCAAAGPGVVSSGRFSAVVDGPEQATADARISGVLDVDASGCWILRSGGGSSPIMWPNGTTLDGNTMSLPGVADALTIGAEIHGAGGEGGRSKADYPPCLARGDTATYIADIALGP